MSGLKTTEKLRNAFSRFTLVLTGVFGLVTTLTLIEEPSRTLQPVASSIAGGRSIASLGSAVGATLANKPFMVTFEAKCENSGLYKTASEHARIKGSNCGFDTELTSVKNSANGYAATVFHQGGETFTTDYMSLAFGENKILIEQKLPTGELRTREITVIRE